MNKISPAYVLLFLALFFSAAIVIYITIFDRALQNPIPTPPMPIIETIAPSEVRPANNWHDYSVDDDATSKISVTFPLNLNTATAEELVCVDGIGEVTAERIIAYRDEIGSYKHLDELQNVYGIGDTTFRQISQYLVIDIDE